MDKQIRVNWTDDGYTVLIDRPEVVWARDIAPILERKSHIYIWNEDGACIEVPPQRRQERAFTLAFWKQAKRGNVLILVC